MAESSALETSRKFAAAYRLGSARARNRVTGQQALGPTHFPVGGVDASSVIVKLAHAALDAGAMRQRREAEQEMAMREFEKSELELQKLRQSTDPTHMTEFQRQSLDLRKQELNRPKTATPRATITLQRDFGRFKAGSVLDPAELLAERDIVRQKAQNDRKGERDSAVQRYTKAVAGLRALEGEGSGKVEVAMQGFNEYLRGKVADLQSKDKDVVNAAVKALGLQPGWSLGGKGNDAVNAAVKGLREEYQQRMKANWSKIAGPRRKGYQDVIDREAGTLLTPAAPAPEEQVDPFEQAILDAVGSLGGGGAEGP